MSVKKFLENPFVITVFASILVFFQVKPAIFLLRLGVFSYSSDSFQLALALSAFLILFIIPFYIIKFAYKKKLSDFGLVIPTNLKQTVKLTTVSLIIFLPIMFILSKQSSFQDYYSVDKNVTNFIILSLISGIYYFSEEFIFRGLLFFGLWEKFKFHSFWVVNLIFMLFHVGKPIPEIILAFFLGLNLTYLSYRTRSFIPAVIVHFTLALILNIIVTFIYPPQNVGIFHF